MIRVGIIGLGANTRLRHVPGLRACRDVEIVGVCNRRPESTEAAADEFGIPKRYPRWADLLADDEVDAVVIGTWPYLHAEATIAALEAGKHVLVEARMARNLAEARAMLAASQQHSQLVTQIVPSPFGFSAHRTVQARLAEGYLGELREVVVLGINDAVTDPTAPIHWRQSAELSGLNSLAMGILHETLIRWVPDPTHVLASSQIFTAERPDPTTGSASKVGTPDSLQILTEIPGGARGIYHLSGSVHFGPGMQIHLYGSEGTLKCDFSGGDRLYGARAGEAQLAEVTIRPEDALTWRVEEEFVAAIRGEEEVQFTDFATGVRYMAFTEAVANSAQRGQRIEIDG